MKMDQIAYYCKDVVEEARVKSLLGLTNDEQWKRDTVTALSSVWGNPRDINVAELQFNYQLGIELEIIRYVRGPHWHQRGMQTLFARGKQPAFISHIGIHLEDYEPFPEMPGCTLAQETWTKEHTSEYLITGPAAGRKYHYKIFEVSPGNFIKYIRRVHPK